MSAAWRRWPSSDVSFSVEWTWAINREARRELEGAARIATERPFPRGCVGGRQQSTCLAPPLPASSYAVSSSTEALHEAVVGPHIHPEGEVGSGFQRHPPLPQSSSASRFTAGAFGFLNLSHSVERPER